MSELIEYGQKSNKNGWEEFSDSGSSEWNHSVLLVSLVVEGEAKSLFEIKWRENWENWEISSILTREKRKFRLHSAVKTNRTRIEE